MSRIARCGCGSLRAEVTGEPMVVVACHCTECQRRTGSPFGVGAYYKKNQVSVAGASTAYRRRAESGGAVTNHFCPGCGSTVYWEAEMYPDGFGVAIGAFTDPDYPQPARSVWERSRHRWLGLGSGIPRHAMGRDSPVLG
ncbi:MAG: GFA family protein [Proteobacteria bacterium]|nr:GFA family protein [Pseudomonadota bacterium]MBI3497299.1 GFA family protein [Pseudomonadota bacterium]